MRNCLLIQAPSPIPKEYRFIPFSISYIAAVLEKHDHSVEIYDMDVLGHRIEDFANTFPEMKFDVVGISSHTVSYKNALRLAGIIKKMNSKVLIVLGGYHVTFMADQVFSDSEDVDIVVLGEGEETFLEIYERYSKSDVYWMQNISGIAYKVKDQVIKTNPRLPLDINKIPFPARHLLPLEKYSTSAIITSRGCPNQCSFCAGSALHPYRVREVKNVVDEIKEMLQMNQHFRQERGLMFLDNTFVNKNTTQQLCHSLKQLNIEWAAESRLDIITKETIKIMRESGCIYLQFGIESGSEHVLNTMNKNISLKKAIEIIDYAISLGLIVTCTFSIGHPEETLEDINKTIDLIQQLKGKGVTVSTSIVTPYPGTQLWKKQKEYKIRIDDYDWEKYSFFNAVMSTNTLSKAQIHSAFLNVLATTESYVSFNKKKEM